MPEHEVHGGPLDIALTFDDGPSPLYTPALLSVLASHDVLATFFMLGCNVARYPDVVRAVTAAGHTVANHSWDHPAFATLPEAAVREQIVRTQDALLRVTGLAPALFRAPGGQFTPAVMKVCAELGLRPISWSLSSVDSGTRTAARISRTVLDGARAGAIVLHHDGVQSNSDIPPHEGAADRTRTVDAVRAYLPLLLERGYRFTTPDRHPAIPGRP